MFFIPRGIWEGKPYSTGQVVGDHLIEEYGLKIYEKMIFPDHYVFSKNEILNIIKKAKDNKLEIIMTEKDFFKIRNFEIDNLKYLKVSLVINKKEKLINIINNLYEKNY